jgi:hypothetical protein
MPETAQKPSILKKLYNKVMPQEGIVPRMFGGVMSNRMATKYPEVEASFAGRSIEFPENAAKVNRIGEMGWLKRKLTGDAYGSTSPLGTIELNMPAIRRDGQDLNDVLSHEMAHAGQGLTGFLKSFYSPEPEHKAINAEVLRKVRKTDIPLRGK